MSKDLYSESGAAAVPSSNPADPVLTVTPPPAAEPMPGPMFSLAPAAPARDRASGARALVTILGVIAFVGVTMILAYVLDIFIGPDPQGAIGSVILGVVIFALGAGPLAVVIFLPWWQQAVSAPLRGEGRRRAMAILWWSAGACALGMLYALRHLANASDRRLVFDEEITLIPLLLLLVASWVALATGPGWAKVLARVAFIVFFLPWLLYNWLGSIVGIVIMVLGLLSLKKVQPVALTTAGTLPGGSLSPDGAYWWDGVAWRQVSPERRQ